jgi:hypothetical protein
MDRLIVNGCYERQTFEHLRASGIVEFGFDLRGLSENLIVFSELQAIQQSITHEKSYLIFENDRPQTVTSFLDLFKTTSKHLIFTDQLNANYYDSFRTPFYWTFHPLANWRDIFEATYLRGVIFPMKFKEELQDFPFMWDQVEKRSLEVFLSPETRDELSQIMQTRSFVSLDLNRSWHSSYRKLDLDSLSAIKLSEYK